MLNVISAIASILGAVFSCFQAKKAKNAAIAAKETKEKIINKIHLGKLSEIDIKTKNTLQIIGKIGPACNEKSIKGINCQKVAEDVQNYSSFIIKHKHIIKEDKFIEEFCRELLKFCKKLSEAKEFKEKKRAGEKIYNLIHGFSSKIMPLVDNKY